MALKLTAVCELFADELTVFRKGELHLESGDLTSFCVKGDVYEGKVLASMKKKSCDVKVRN
jgi:hypothetical protein